MREEVKELWKLCFPEDSNEFVELYFLSRYKDDITSVIKIDGKIVSALQRIPYPMTYKGYIIQTSYISGACTHPCNRSLGLMTRLLKEAHIKMYNDGILLSTLIPANENLVGFYKKSKYIVGFKQKEECFTYNETNQTKNLSFIKLESAEKRISDIYHFIYEQQSKKSSCILHTFEDMKVIVADHKLSGGEIWAGFSNKDDICSIAFIINEEDKLLIKEIVSLNYNIKEETVNFLLKHYNINSAYMPSLCGMIRIVNSLELLKLYAHNKDIDYLIEVYGDDAISENNGMYLLSEGTCIKLKDEPSKGFFGIEHLRLSISELAEFLFRNESPYMSLMLN